MVVPVHLKLLSEEIVVRLLKDGDKVENCMNELRLIVEYEGGISIIDDLLSSENKRKNTIGVLLLEELSGRVIKENKDYLTKIAENLSTDPDPWKRKAFVQFAMCLEEKTDDTIFRICAMLGDIHLDVRCWAIRFISKLPMSGRDLSKSFLMDQDRSSTNFPYKDRAYRAMKIAELLANGNTTSFIFKKVSYEDSYTVDFFKWFEELH